MRYCEASTSLVHLDIVTKIGTTFNCQFSSVGTCEAWIKQINALLFSPKHYKTSFSVLFREELKQRIDNHPLLFSLKEIIGLGDKDTSFEASMVYYEFERLEFNSDWKITDENNSICKSYPRYHIMPRGVSDQDISSMASFRSHHRFPSVVWRSRKTGAVLLRCAQPCVGIMYSRNELDERFVAAVLENCRKVLQPSQSDGDSHKLLIVDARDYTAAQFNRFRGGGFEFGEYYNQSQIRFMNLPNLHYVRKSFEALIALYRNPDSSWLQKVDTTMWLSYISQLLKSAVDIVAALEVHSRPVMVHCTDGWDRTPQLTSLAKLLLDPYYRTIEGFRFLVEREWLQFGHKFADRCGHSFSRTSSEEQSPIFLQWLDCVHQIHRQFPSHFQFNELFLIKIAIHTYSGLFGTFLCNSEFERQGEQKNLPSCSLWAFLNPKYNWSILNYLYKPNDEVITPAYHVSDLALWQNLYKKALLPSSSSGPQSVLFSAPLRRGSDTSTLQITATKLNVPAKSGPSTAASTLMPPPTPINILAGAEDLSMHASNAEARQRSQSFSNISIQHGQVNLPSTVSSSSLKDIPKQSADTAPRTQTELSIERVDEVLNVSLSDQNISAKVSPHKHVRTGSDPPLCSESRMFRGFRLSSFGDNDTLVVNETTLDDSHEVVEEEDMETTFSRTPVTRIPEEMMEERKVYSNRTAASLHPSQNLSAASSVCQSQVSLSGINFEGKVNWIEGYFGGPVYSNSFRILAKESKVPLEDEVSAIQNEPSGQDEENSGERSNDSSAQSTVSRTRSHTESEIQSSLQRASNRNLPRSTSQLTSEFGDLSTGHSNGQSCGSTASGETQLLPEHSVSVDWDGLPLQIDQITMKFHEELRKRDQHVAELQAQLEALRELNEQLEAKLNEKNDVAAAIATTSYYSANGSASTMLATSQTQLPTNVTHGIQSSSLAFGHNGNGNEPANQSSSIVEALTDAIDNQLEVESGFGGYGNGFEVNHHLQGVINDSVTAAPQLLMTQSATDDMLLNWPTMLASTPSSISVGVPPISNSLTSDISSLPEFQPPMRRKRCGPSTSSDYSTFDFVETSAVPSGPSCSGCDRLLDVLNSSVTCSFCHRYYCGGCADTPQILNTCCKPICGVCHRRHFPEAREMSASYECTFPSRPSTSGTICSQSCGNTGGSCRNLEQRFPSGSSLACSSGHSQNGTAKA
ncbi:unnamed protein product [Rodentolepis nana]|uniref:Phosphatidylinositol-3-phosphatase n=1 Tax=Rodentolepis nana TaxID=102285 RepID=A0A158QGY2_RODNA|nr:unnamed protein product [Rodentolepis nana]